MNRRTLAVLVFSVAGACATAERPTSPPEVVTDIYFEPITLPDGGQAIFTRPSVDQKVLTAGLMPEGHPGGILFIKCHLTAEGEIYGCVSLKGDARLASVTIERLQSMRATPATLDGKPIPMDYVFNLVFKP
jgi:hypothetical protein